MVLAQGSAFRPAMTSRYGHTSSTATRMHGQRCARPSRRLQVQALFGWGKKDSSGKDAMWERQKEILKQRQSGDQLREASVRRQKVSDTLRARKEERKKERDSLGEGIIPDTLKNWKNYSKKEDEEGRGGIIVPLFPFGRVNYDEGERFDLRSPYADDGWVDPDEVDAWAGLKGIGKKLLNFGGNKKAEDTTPKPVIWASQYSKYLAEKAKKIVPQSENNDKK